MICHHSGYGLWSWVLGATRQHGSEQWRRSRSGFIELLPEGGYLATSPDVPGLVAEGRTVTEATEIAQGLARKIVESCLEHGDAVPPALSNLIAGGSVDLLVPVGIR